MSVAGKVTRGVLSADVVIASGPITVYGIIVANSSAASVEVDFEDRNGIVKHTVTVPGGDSKTWSVPFIAEGLTANSISSSNVIVTVYHTSEGT